MPPSFTRDEDNALGLFLSLKTARADNAHDRNNTTINHDNGGGQNVAEQDVGRELWQQQRQQLTAKLAARIRCRHWRRRLLNEIRHVKRSFAPNHQPVSCGCRCK